MAEHILNTVIQLRYGTYEQWEHSSVILKLGEAAICSFPRQNTLENISNSEPEYTPPAIGIKIGDGHKYFSQLPWVQGIAADVYSWAKAEYKPTYSAQEIEGLQAFVENLIGGDVEVNIAPRIYQLVQGTNENANKYYLRYKENTDDSPWIIDTSTAIDLTNLAKVIQWIGLNFIDYYDNLSTFNAELIEFYLASLTPEQQDTEETNKFVTSVQENNGLINVTKVQPDFSNLSGHATVNQGGTGRSTLTEDAVLVGNGTNQVKLIPIAETIENNTHLVPNYLIKAYVDNATAGLSSAMHFIGDATVVINNNSAVDPNIIMGNGKRYNFSEAQPGDVILYDAKEFVWTGSSWRLLGDETSYAIKGSIKDSDISADANIQQSKIAELGTTFNTKVDKEDGKTLTSNDFTDELKEKLDNIEEFAQSNTIQSISLNGTAIVPTANKNVNIDITEITDKLSTIEEGAEVNTITSIRFDDVTYNPNSEKAIVINSNPHTEHINKIEHIFVNGTEILPQTINDEEKSVNVVIDPAALDLQVLEGAIVPNGNTIEPVNINNKRLELARIAKTGDIQDLLQTSDTYIILNCGSSTDVI